MPITCLEDLIKLGWVKNGNNGYLRPDKRVVSRKRQLSMSERHDFGDILFPAWPRLDETLVIESHCAGTDASLSEPVAEPLVDLKTINDTQGAQTYEGDKVGEAHVFSWPEGPSSIRCYVTDSLTH